MFFYSRRWQQVALPDRAPSSCLVRFQSSRRLASISNPRELQPCWVGEAGTRAVSRRLAGGRLACLSCFAPDTRRRAALPGARRREKIPRYSKRGREPVFREPRRSDSQVPFKTADIGPVDSGIDRKHLLRELTRDPKPPYVSSDQRACFHQGKIISLRPIKPRTIVLVFPVNSGARVFARTRNSAINCAWASIHFFREQA